MQEKVKDYIVQNRLVLEAAFFFAFSITLVNLSGVQNTQSCGEIFAEMNWTEAFRTDFLATLKTAVKTAFRLGFTGSGLISSLGMFFLYIGFEALMLNRGIEKRFLVDFMYPSEEKTMDFFKKINLVSITCFLIAYIAMTFIELQNATFSFTVTDAIIGNFTILFMFLLSLLPIEFVRKAMVKKIFRDKENEGDEGEEEKESEEAEKEKTEEVKTEKE